MAAKNTKNKSKGKEDKSVSTCSDLQCPIHGSVKLRGRTLVGIVESDKMSKTVVVSWTRRFFVKKYERYEMRRSKINAHNPDCISAKKGDIVKIIETRPLSKTKHFSVVEIIGKESKKEHLKTEEIEVQEAIQEAKDTAREQKKAADKKDKE
ncbi:30S ribosomal protein S17 [Candidatus Woesearchaeota archaeon]|nr:30S ribosomal protein S17 [Candidatus Woesearchaeota archaeon]